MSQFAGKAEAWESGMGLSERKFKKAPSVHLLQPLEDKNDADHPVNYKAFLPSGLAPDIPLITQTLSSFPAIDWCNYDCPAL